MQLSERLEQIVKELRPGFSREATFQWFLILLWGIVVSTQPPAITSYLNALGLGPEYYGQALHWFHSTGFSIDGLCQCWSKWLEGHPHVRPIIFKLHDGIESVAGDAPKTVVSPWLG